MTHRIALHCSIPHRIASHLRGVFAAMNPDPTDLRGVYAAMNPIATDLCGGCVGRNAGQAAESQSGGDREGDEQHPGHTQAALRAHRVRPAHQREEPVHQLWAEEERDGVYQSMDRAAVKILLSFR